MKLVGGGNAFAGTHLYAIVNYGKGNFRFYLHAQHVFISGYRSGKGAVAIYFSFVRSCIKESVDDCILINNDCIYRFVDKRIIERVGVIERKNQMCSRI